MRMTAHAIDGDDQGGVIDDQHRGTVLVIVPPAEKTDVGVLDPQAGDQC